jgi:hypothetical protein
MREEESQIIEYHSPEMSWKIAHSITQGLIRGEEDSERKKRLLKDYDFIVTLVTMNVESVVTGEEPNEPIPIMFDEDDSDGAWEDIERPENN